MVDSGDGPVFYASFTTGGRHEFAGSAICAFTVKSVDDLLDNGSFKEQVSSSSAWTTVLPSQVPTPRPGRCDSDTKEMTDSSLHFVKSHSLIDGSVPMRADAPVYYIRGVQLGQLAVDIVPNGNSAPITVLFVASGIEMIC